MPVTNLKVELARRIVLAREIEGWNQAEMARRMSMTPASWNAYESGATAVTVERLLEIAPVTNKPVAFFIPGDTQPDLPTALLALYPHMDPGTVRSIVRIANRLYQDDLELLERSVPQ